jgi:solute carrier family 15 (peptide/histidine transporter), member 3/4
MAIGGFVDWKGTLINGGVHGGVRAAWFIYCKCIYAKFVFYLP